MRLMLDRRFIAFLLSAFPLVGCQWSEDRSLDREVISDEVVGVWVLNLQSIRDLESIGFQLEEDRTSHKIIIESDGTCDFHTFLAMDVVFGRHPPIVSSSRCRWELGNEDRQDLSLELIDLPRKVARYHLTETAKGELVIWQYIADPDHWKYVEYAKFSGAGGGS